MLSLLLLGCSNTNFNKNITTTATSNIYNNALNAYSEKNWALSYRLYKEIKEKNRSDYDASFKLGVSSIHLGRIDEAESYFMDAIKIKPNHQKSIYNLAIIHLNKTNSYINKYIEITPPNERDPDFIKLAVLFNEYIK